MAEFQNQADSLRSLMSKCLPAGPAPVADNSDSDCQKISKDYADVLQKINQAGQKADMFEKIDKASAGDLKAGMQITVYGREIKQVENQAAPVVAITGNFEDISEKLKFETSRIEAREAPVSPVAMPAPVTR